jgi:predicted phage tail protein
LEIQPFYGDEVLTTHSVQIRINPADRKRARELLAATADIIVVKDEQTFTLARHSLGQLKALLEEIEKGKKAVKQPFDQVLALIGETAKELWDPVMNEHRRIQELLNGYVKQLEDARKEEERKHREETRRLQQDHDRKIAEARAAQAKAEEDARKALDETARLKAKADAQAQLLVAANEQLAKEIALEASNMFESQKRGLVPGGRVDHNYEFTLVDLPLLIKSGSLRLLRWEVDHRACQDACQAQLQIDPSCEPTLPGIQVTRKLNVNVRAARP